MKITIKKNVDLSKLTTMKIGGRAAHFAEVQSTMQLQEALAWAESQKIPYYVLGGGSNTIFDDGFFDGLVLAMAIKGVEVVKDTADSSIVRIGAGENWDDSVAKVVAMDHWGIEALSGIPGKTGAAPYQNIGAYGQEIKDTLHLIEAYDTSSKKLVSLSNADCKFGYRDSIFKSEHKGRYIITNVLFKLSKKPLGLPQYKDIINYFADREITEPSLSEIRNAILEIRKNKFVDPSKVPNSGSFFKNPTVDSITARKLMKKFPDIKPFPEDNKIFPLDDGKYKVAAGWLLQTLGYKGKDFGKIRIDPNHALVLGNHNRASQQDLIAVIDQIQADVNRNYGIMLEPEPVIVKFSDLIVK